jgi:hypothetical protein
MRLKLDHLTLSDHTILARRLREIQDDLAALRPIVQRVPFSEQTMLVQKRIQESLIDPLSEALGRLDEREDRHRQKDLYPAVHYAVGRVR